MLQEDYCSYEVAKLLKEKGFDVKSYHQYYVSSCGKVFGWLYFPTSRIACCSVLSQAFVGEFTLH